MGYGFCQGCAGTEADCTCTRREVMHYMKQSWYEGYDAGIGDQAVRDTKGGPEDWPESTRNPYDNRKPRPRPARRPRVIPSGGPMSYNGPMTDMTTPDMSHNSNPGGSDD